MHEMGITQGILSASFDAAKAAGADRICEIRISIGELTEIQEFALQFAFEALTPDTMAEGANLHVTHISATSHCNECGLDYAHDRFQMLCPECGSFSVTQLTGREMQIDSIETPDEDGTCPPVTDRYDPDALPEG
jgi:hydrogenase nickel incorporation protein HypA/HybF